MIKLFEPKFGARELKAVSRIFKSGILTSGPEVRKLEINFAKYVGSKYAIAVNSCTSALYLSLKCPYKPSAIAVEVPSVTFASVAAMVSHADYELRFKDVIKVGQAYELGHTTVVDSAHYLERFCYGSGSLTCYSFYPTKILGGAEGGMIATNKLSAAEWLRKARNNGIVRRDGMFDWDYEVEFPGWKMNMTDIQAAILNVRLKDLDLINYRRQHICEYYNFAFGLKNSSLHVYPVLVDNREEVIRKFKKDKIGYSVNFKPLHLQPAFKDVFKPNLPKSEWWGKHEISIPFHDNLRLDDAKKIVSIIKPYVIEFKQFYNNKGDKK